MAVLIFAIGGGMSFYEGIKHLEHPEPLEDPLWNYVVLGVSILFEGAALVLAMRALLEKQAAGSSVWHTLRTSRDPAVFASVLENAAAVAGLLIALLGVYFGHLLHNPSFDGGASIIIGLLLMGVAVLLVARTKNLLVGEGVSDATLEQQARSVAEAGELSHGDFGGRMSTFGIGGYAAENLSAGSSDVAGAITRWKNSPNHNENLLLAQAKRIGLARADTPGRGYGHYWALVLAQ